jgi:hypothetical protein
MKPNGEEEYTQAKDEHSRILLRPRNISNPTWLRSSLSITLETSIPLLSRNYPRLPGGINAGVEKTPYTRTTFQKLSHKYRNVQRLNNKKTQNSLTR